MDQNNNKKIAIIGGGIVGLSICYYLMQFSNDYEIILIERDAIASCSSGKAGGFLAKDWNDNSPLKELSRLSYNLHEKLADKLNGKQKYGFRNVDVYQISANEIEDDKGMRKGLPDSTEWLSSKFDIRAGEIGTKSTCAQVDPFLFCNTLLEEIKDKIKIIHQGANHILEEEEDKIKIILDDSDIQVDKVVLAMGPWSSTLNKSLKELNLESQLPTITSSRAHSIIFEPKPQEQSNTHVVDLALFTHVNIKNKSYEVEIYPRPNKHVYICGLGDTIPLPKHSNLIEPNEQSINKLIEIGKQLIPCLNKYNVIKKQTCYLPYSDTGLPIFGPIKKNIFFASGHSCWGILNAPATGYLLSKLILEHQIGLDLEPFLPK